MFGWLRLARICASRVNRARRFRIRREGVGEDLQGDLTVELSVGGLPDLAHPARAEEGGDVVEPEAVTGGQGHGLWCLLTGLVYAQAVNGSSLRCRCARERAQMRSRGSAAGGGVWGARRSLRGVRALSCELSGRRRELL